MEAIKGRLVNVKQGTDDWLNFRLVRYGASEVRNIVSAFQKRRGDSMPIKCDWGSKDFESFARMKLGMQIVWVNSAMKEGVVCEPRACELAEYVFDMEFAKLTYANENLDLPLVASLDGINMDGDILIEIKTSKKTIRELTRYYYYQIQQQLMLSGAQFGFIVRYDKIRDDIQISKPIENDAETQELIVSAWQDFHKYFQEFKKENAHAI